MPFPSTGGRTSPFPCFTLCNPHSSREIVLLSSSPFTHEEAEAEMKPSPRSQSCHTVARGSAVQSDQSPGRPGYWLHGLPAPALRPHSQRKA